MKFRNWLTAAALCAASLSSQAGVIYEWRALNKELPQDFKLTLEFDAAAVRSGSLLAQLEPWDYEEVFADSGLLFLSYSAAGRSLTFSPRTEPMLPQYGYLSMNLQFEPGGFLSGTMFAANQEHSFEIASQGGVFTVLHANSDTGMPGCESASIQCFGASGMMQQVPEPGSIALFGVGFAAAFGIYARRKLPLTAGLPA